MADLPRPSRPSLVLAGVCLLHGVSSLALVGLRHGLGWDETVYLSQINRFVPAGIWSAPRSRGLTLLVAPVTLVTPSLAATRLWLAFLSSVLLYLGFRPWLRLVPAYAVALAALLFSGLWQTLYYGAEAMPNLFVACFLVPAVALTVLYLREPERWTRLLWLAGCLTAIALIRPSDAVYAAVPIGAAALVARGYAWRPRLLVLAALAGGAVAGAAEWVVEAYTSFGGPLNRYHLAIAEQGGSGLHFSLGAHARALAGPILCRGTCDPHPAWWVMAWWFVLPLLVALGLALARRTARFPLVAALVTALAMAAQYILGIAYAAPRFLMPSYALLFIVVAVGMTEAVARAPQRAARAAAVAVVSVVVLAQLVTQTVILRTKVLPPNDRGLALWSAESWALQHDVTGGGSCVVAGPSTPPIAYGARCKSISITSIRTETFPATTLRVFMSRDRVATAGTFLGDWTEYRLTLPKDKGYSWVYLPPGQQPRGDLRAG